MDEMRSSSPSSNNNSSNNNIRQEMSMVSRMKKGCLSFATSLEEGYRYTKAFFVGQAKQMTARDEKEATRAEMETAKMQVEATDEAEEKKRRLEDKSK